MIDEIQAKQLADLVVSYIQTRRDKKEESFYKDKPKKNKQGIITNGAINFRLLELAKQLAEDQETVKTIEKAKKQKQQTALVFQKLKYEQLLHLFPENVISNELVDIISELKSFLLELDQEFNPVNWLTEWTAKAKDISFATHVAKLTHSSSKGSCILDRTTEKNERYLTTNSLDEAIIDTASSNAASQPIADVLKLSVEDISIYDCIKSGETGFLKFLTDDEKLIDTWIECLRQAYDSDEKKSHFLNKQAYFPVGENQYHLLLPLTSSSLVQEIYLEHQKYFNDESKAAREQKKKGAYSAVEVRFYPNKADQVLTSDIKSHLNVSLLNKNRLGKISLLPTTPPQWQSRYQSAIKKQSVFDAELSYQLKDEITELRKYLVLLKKEQLSLNKPERNAAIARKLSAISDTFFDYIQLLSQNEVDSGWTMHSDMPIEEQLLFEPNRDDEQATAEKSARAWAKKLSQSYGRWLNNQLKNKQLTLTTIHAQLWERHFFNELREYIAIEEINE